MRFRLMFCEKLLLLHASVELKSLENTNVTSDRNFCLNLLS